jgi:thiol:disulfide interchange protein DsbD
VILLVGAAMGNEDLFQPLSSRTHMISHGVPFVKIKTLSELNDALATAKQNRQPVMIDFYADWCVSCLEMENTAFADSDVKASVNNFVVLQIDVTKNDAMDRAIEDNFNVVAPPTVLFFGPDGQELTAYRVVGAMNPANFLGHLQKMKKAIIGL